MLDDLDRLRRLEALPREGEALAARARRFLGPLAQRLARAPGSPPASDLVDDGTTVRLDVRFPEAQAPVRAHLAVTREADGEVRFRAEVDPGGARPDLADRWRAALAPAGERLPAMEVEVAPDGALRADFGTGEAAFWAFRLVARALAGAALAERGSGGG